jgi:hypothetical protein
VAPLDAEVVAFFPAQDGEPLHQGRGARFVQRIIFGRYCQNPKPPSAWRRRFVSARLRERARRKVGR